MIAIQAITLATMIRFLNLRSGASRRSSTGQLACSAIIVSSLEKLSGTSDSLAAVDLTLFSFAVIGDS